MNDTQTVLGWELEEDVETGEAHLSGKVVVLGEEARSRGVYVVGSTGTGKTTFLESVAYQDMKNGHGLCVLDPHGDMIDFLLSHVPPERADDVIYFNPSDTEAPYGLNLLACDRNDPVEVGWVVSTITVTLKRLFAISWGPRLEHVLSHTLWTAMTIPDSTLLEVLLLLTDPIYRFRVLATLDEPMLQTFWEDFPKNELERHELVASTVNKLSPFLLDWRMRNIIGQPKSTIDISNLMDQSKILLVNLSKGELGENNSSLLGSVMVNLILIAALKRRLIPPGERKKRVFHVIVDEYQNFASESFAVLQSEARKYAVDLVVAHQYRDQLDVINRGAALNVGNFVCFRTTGVDGPELASQFDNSPPIDVRYEPLRLPSDRFTDLSLREPHLDEPIFGPTRLYSDMLLERANELTNLPLFHAQARIIGEQTVEGKKQYPLSQHHFLAPNPHDPDQAGYFGTENMSQVQAIVDRSRKKAPKREAVEQDIRRRTFERTDFSVPPASLRRKKQE